MRGLWLAGVAACVLVWTDNFPVSRSVVGAELGTWHQEIRAEVCGYWLIVSGRIYEDVQGEQKEVAKWTEITRKRLTVTVEEP